MRFSINLTLDVEAPTDDIPGILQALRNDDLGAALSQLEVLDVEFDLTW